MENYLNKIICGDCIEWLGQIEQPFADLVFADPPFNIGYKYDKYYDKRKKENYIAWTKQWMTLCRDVLKPHGSFYIAIGDDYAANVKVIADEIGLTMRNWIIWHYTFGQQTKSKFARAHTHIFYFVKDSKNFTFNDHAVRVPSDRQLLYNDRRANPLGKIPDDVWNTDSRVCGTFNERVQWHPCQMPENLLKRIIAASSNEADCVMDPFSGSATTAAAALQMGRNYVGIEVSENYAEQSRQRLAQLSQDISRNGDIVKDQTQRLLADTRISPKKLLKDKKLLRIFVNQLSVRAGNRQFAGEEVAGVLREIGERDTKMSTPQLDFKQ